MVGSTPIILSTSLFMIELNNVTKQYGDTVVVDDISFAVAEGELLVLLGDS
ncbi:MAG: hypothetical protein GTO40_17985, partial [Deltaproteobacteria bacterium]|nr:hypothetical protein [Deltaproteobacteria bacterium]